MVRRTRSVLPSTSLLYFTLIVTAVSQSASTCNYNGASLATTSLCIDTTSALTAEASLTLPPLFSQLVKFVYAVDGLTKDEAVQYDSLLGNTGISDSTMVAYWFDYDLNEVAIDEKVNATMETAFKVYFAKFSDAQVGDGNGGCDRLLGSMCTGSIKNWIQYMTFDDNEIKPLDELSDASQWANIVGCPLGLYREQLAYGGAEKSNEEMAVQNSNPNAVAYSGNKLLPPGNSSAAWGRSLNQNRPLSEQLNYAAITIVARYQSLDRSLDPNVPKKRKDSSLQIAMACAKIAKPAASVSEASMLRLPGLGSVMLMFGVACSYLWI